MAELGSLLVEGNKFVGEAAILNTIIHVDFARLQPLSDLSVKPELIAIGECNIYYNAAVLSRVYEQKKATNDQMVLNIIPSISLVAWLHVNLGGKFEFSPATSHVDIDALATRFGGMA